MYSKNCYPVYGKAYWMANLESISLFFCYPEIDKLMELLEVKKTVYSVLTQCSNIVTRQIRNEDLIRIFIHSIPVKLRTEQVVLISAKLANYYYNYSMNIAYVENNLKCNLSVNLWKEIIKSVGFFMFETKKTTPTYSASVYFQLSKFLIDSQLDYTNYADELSPFNPANKSYQNLNSFKNNESFSKLRKVFKLDVRSNGEDIEDFDERSHDEHSELGEDEDGEDEDEEERQTVSDSFSDQSSEDDEEEELEDIGSLDPLDNLLGGENFSKKESEPSLNVTKTDKKSSFSMALRMKTRANIKRGSNKSSVRNDEDNQNQSISSGNSNQSITLNKSDSERIPSTKKLVSNGPTLKMMEFGLERKIERRNLNVYNDVRMKKVNFSEKFKLEKLTNLARSEQIIKTVSIQTPKDWDNFDIYDGLNRYQIKEVLTAFIKNFKENLSLSITNEKDLASSLMDFNKDILVKNNNICKKKPSKQSATLFLPSLGLMKSKKKSSLEKKIRSFFYEKLDQIINAQIASTIKIKEAAPKIKQYLNVTFKEPKKERSTSEIMDPTILLKSQENLVYNRTKTLFAGKTVSQSTHDYLTLNLHNTIYEILQAPSKLVLKQVYKTTAMLDIPNIIFTASSPILKWMSVISINLMSIMRRFEIIKVKNSPNYQTLEELKACLENVLSETLLQGARFTVFIDLTEITEKSEGKVEKLREVIDFIGLVKNGKILSLYPSEFFQNIILSLRKENFILAMPYDSLIKQVKKIIQTNISFFIITESTFSFSFASFVHENYSNVFSYMVKFSLQDMTPSSNFTESCHHHLNTSFQKQGGSQIKDHSNLEEHRKIFDIKLMRTTLGETRPTFASLLNKRKESKCSLTQEKMPYVLDLGLAFGIHSKIYSIQDYETAIKSVEEFLNYQPDWSTPDRVTELTTNFIADCFSGVNFPKLLRNEEGFIRLISEGVSLQAQDVNSIELVNVLMMDEYSFVPLVYDPLGIARAYFKNRSANLKNENSTQFFEYNEKNEDGFLDRIENGTKLFLSVQKMSHSSLQGVMQLLRTLSMYFLGKDMGFYSSKDKAPPLTLGGKSVQMHASFKLCIILQRKKDFNELCKNLSSSNLFNIMRLISFSESVNSLLSNPVPIVRDLEHTQRLNEWFAQTTHFLLSDKSQGLFNHFTELPGFFHLQEHTTTKNINFLKQEDQRLSFEFLPFLFSISCLDSKDSSKLHSYNLPNVCDITIQFKSQTQSASPFESTYENKYFTPNYRSVSVTFKKVLFYFSKVRSRHNPFFDAHFIGQNFKMLFEQFRDYMQHKHHSRAKYEQDLTIYEVDAKYGVGVLNEKFVKLVDKEQPNFWDQFNAAFVHHCSRMIGREERKEFLFWIWVNHVAFEEASYDKFVYSTTLQRRYTVNTQGGNSKAFATESELEYRDLRTLLTQEYLDTAVRSLSPDTSMTSNMKEKKQFEDNLLAVYKNLRIENTRESFVFNNPFKPILDENTIEHSRISFDERIEPPTRLNIIPRNQNSSNNPSEGSNKTPTGFDNQFSSYNETKRISMFIPVRLSHFRASTQHTKKTYKMSRFATSKIQDVSDPTSHLDERTNILPILEDSHRNGGSGSSSKRNTKRENSGRLTPNTPDIAYLILQRNLGDHQKDLPKEQKDLLKKMDLAEVPNQELNKLELGDDYDEEESIESQIRRRKSSSQKSNEESPILKNSKFSSNMSEEMIISPLKARNKTMVGGKKGKAQTKKKITFHFDTISPKHTILEAQNSISPLRNRLKKSRTIQNECNIL